MSQLEAHIRATPHFEFFWSPREDACACKALQPTEVERVALPAAPVVTGRLKRYIGKERIDFSHRLFPSERNLRFNEMEFAVPERNGPDCVRELRHLMQLYRMRTFSPMQKSSSATIKAVPTGANFILTPPKNWPPSIQCGNPSKHFASRLSPTDAL